MKREWKKRKKDRGREALDAEDTTEERKAERQDGSKVREIKKKRKKKDRIEEEGDVDVDVKAKPIVMPGSKALPQPILKAETENAGVRKKRKKEKKRKEEREAKIAELSASKDVTGERQADADDGEDYHREDYHREDGGTGEKLSKEGKDEKKARTEEKNRRKEEKKRKKAEAVEEAEQEGEDAEATGGDGASKPADHGPDRPLIGSTSAAGEADTANKSQKSRDKLAQEAQNTHEVSRLPFLSLQTLPSPLLGHMFLS